MVHALVKPGIYIVGGINITDYEDATIFLIYDKVSHQCLIIGSGRGTSLHAILRNILELGISINEMKYLLVIPWHRVAGGCKIFKEFMPTIHVVSHPKLSKFLRNGEDPYDNVEYDPCPITVEKEEVHLNSTVISIKLIELRDMITPVILVDDVCILRTLSETIKVDIAKFACNILCFFDSPQCIRIK